MRKFKKLLMTLGIACVMSVGVVAGAMANYNSDIEGVSAETFSATYHIDSKSSISLSAGTNPSDNTILTYSQNYTTAGQLTSGNKSEFIISNFGLAKITGISINAHSNSSKGAGGFNVKVGTNVFNLVSGSTKFNKWGNNTRMGTDFRWVDFTLPTSGYDVLEDDKVIFEISCSTNSLYISDYKITYDKTVEPSVTDITPNPAIETQVIAEKGKIITIPLATVTADEGVNEKGYTVTDPVFTDACGTFAAPVGDNNHGTITLTGDVNNETFSSTIKFSYVSVWTDSQGNAFKNDITINVVKPTVTSVVIDPIDYDYLTKGDKLTLSATTEVVHNADQSVTWESSNPTVATIDATTGDINVIGFGEVTFTAKAKVGELSDSITLNSIETTKKEQIASTEYVSSGKMADTDITGSFTRGYDYVKFQNGSSFIKLPLIKEAITSITINPSKYSTNDGEVLGIKLYQSEDNVFDENEVVSGFRHGSVKKNNLLRAFIPNPKANNYYQIKIDVKAKGSAYPIGLDAIKVYTNINPLVSVKAEVKPDTKFVAGEAIDVNDFIITASFEDQTNKIVEGAKLTSSSPKFFKNGETTISFAYTDPISNTTKDSNKVVITPILATTLDITLADVASKEFIDTEDLVPEDFVTGVKINYADPTVPATSITNYTVTLYDAAEAGNVITSISKSTQEFYVEVSVVRNGIEITQRKQVTGFTVNNLAATLNWDEANLNFAFNSNFALTGKLYLKYNLTSKQNLDLTLDDQNLKLMVKKVGESEFTETSKTEFVLTKEYQGAEIYFIYDNGKINAQTSTMAITLEDKVTLGVANAKKVGEKVVITSNTTPKITVTIEGGNPKPLINSSEIKGYQGGTISFEIEQGYVFKSFSYVDTDKSHYGGLNGVSENIINQSFFSHYLNVRAYFSSMSFTYFDVYGEKLDSFFNDFLYMNDTAFEEPENQDLGLCKGPDGGYELAHAELMRLEKENPGIIEKFRNGDYTAERARYETWGRFNDKTVPEMYGEDVSSGSFITNEDSTSIIITIVTVSIIGISSIAAFAILAKRKKANATK